MRFGIEARVFLIASATGRAYISGVNNQFTPNFPGQAHILNEQSQE